MKTWISRALATEPGALGPLLLRVVLAAVILPHGLQKTAGWFGGYGFSGTMAWFTDTMHIPWILAFAAVATESVGAVLLFLGAATRLSALAVGITMSVAMLTVHAEHGFFMNWFGNQQGEGIEFFLLAIGISAALVVSGGGRASFDARLQRRSALVRGNAIGTN